MSVFFLRLTLQYKISVLLHANEREREREKYDR